MPPTDTRHLDGHFGDRDKLFNNQKVKDSPLRNGENAGLQNGATRSVTKETSNRMGTSIIRDEQYAILRALIDQTDKINSMKAKMNAEESQKPRFAVSHVVVPNRRDDNALTKVVKLVKKLRVEMDKIPATQHKAINLRIEANGKFTFHEVMNTEMGAKPTESEWSDCLQNHNSETVKLETNALKKTVNQDWEKDGDEECYYECSSDPYSGSSDESE